ncbi:phosphatidylinositol 3-kinase 2-like isoform X2 [Mizuhopecten yessoensis]|uniref:phosphatidylinositol 3-kinase 2-like isoform X2 n=1 Tax=Mizuhopecten yessoensis TaxID=6573 RepID=UPI000B45F05B|nr:phosphatidylinositol 3-kinase 2-like isoform X2 [Mizuhopecten yessoensis]XP_021369863.1 phosphatidylinositol 3-kinase 2-like isoform X2 [Mizuhopecten yessoensis]
MEDENVLLVDVTVPPEMDSPLDFSRPLISSHSPQLPSKVTEDTSNKENADATIDSIEIERSDESDRRHSLTLSTPGALHHRILRDVTQKSTCSNAVSSPVISMLEDEMFDFDFALSPASGSLERSQEEEEEEEEEVFFGPMGFAERCVAQAVGPEVKPLSPLNAGQIAELVKEAALVAYRLKTDYKNSSLNESESPPKKRHSRSGTFTMDSSPLKLLSLPIIESEEPSPEAETTNKPDSASKKNGGTVTKGNKENLLEQGRKLVTPNRSKSRRSGLVPPANKAKKSLHGVFKAKPTEKNPEEDVPTESEAQVTRPDVKSRTSNPVPVIKQALTSKIPDKKSGLARPTQRLQPPKSIQPPKSHLAVKAIDTSSSTSIATTGSKPPSSSLKRSLQPPKTFTKDSDMSNNNSVNASANRTVSNPNRRSIQPLKSCLAVKTDSSTNRNTNSTSNRKSLNTTISMTGSRSITPASGKESKLKIPGSSGTKLNRSYTISEPKSTNASEAPGSKRPASKLSLLQPSQIKKKTIAMPSNTKVSNGPVKAMAPAGIQSRTVEKKPSVRLGSSSSGHVSMSTPIKVQKNVQPKLLSSTFTATPSTSGSTSNFMSSTPSSTSKRRSCLPTPNSSRTSSISSISSIPPPSPLSCRSGSSTSSYSSVCDSPFTTRGRGPRLARKQSVGMYASLDEINEHSPSALMAACKISTTNA